MQTPPGAGTVLLRYGEVGTKSSRVRGQMVTQLCENVTALLADRGVPGDVEYRMARPVVHTDDPVATASVAADAPGVVSTSPALRVDSTFDAVADALARTARTVYEEGTFAVRAHRSTDDLPFTSEDIEVDGGSAVWEAVEDEFDPSVDLEDPDVTFHVEARREDAYVYLEVVPGPGGLPLGSQADLVALVSGGIDSPVAAHEAMRRGARVTPVYLDLGKFGGVDHRTRAVESVRTLSQYDPELDGLVVVPAGDTVAHLVETMDRGRMLSFRRYMYCVAEHIAADRNAHGVVTGEAIGQKSSQTVQNFGVTSRATDLPVHRPLLTVDKTDITDRAREVGTFREATVPAGCNRVVPDRPETNASLQRLREVEPADLFERAAADADAAEFVTF